MASLSDTADRRGAQRFPLRRKPVLKLSSGGRSYLAALDDLSLSGARLRVSGATPPGAPITLHHPVMGDLAADPVWRSGNAMGVRFANTGGALEHTLQCVGLMLHQDEFAV